MLLTIGEVAYGQPAWRFCQVSQCYIRLTLSDHQVDNDQRFEHNGPCRVSKAILQGSEDLGDSGLAAMRCC